MELETLADLGSVASAIIGLLGLLGLGTLVHKFVIKKQNIVSVENSPGAKVDITETGFTYNEITNIHNDK